MIDPIYKDPLMITLAEALKEKSLKSKRLSYHPFNCSIICPFSKLEYTLYKEFHPSHFIILLQISHEVVSIDFLRPVVTTQRPTFYVLAILNYKLQTKT